MVIAGATMYSEDHNRMALAVYDKCGSVTKVITQLGYPVRWQTLYHWIARRKYLPSGHSTFRGINTAAHPRHPALELKLDAIRRCFELGENVQSVSDEIGYSKASIYQWRRKYIQEGRAALMEPPKERQRGPLSEGTPAANEQISGFKEQVSNMQVEIDSLKATLDASKKDPGVDRRPLKNRKRQQ